MHSCGNPLNSLQSILYKLKSVKTVIKDEHHIYRNTKDCPASVASFRHINLLCCFSCLSERNGGAGLSQTSEKNGFWIHAYHVIMTTLMLSLSIIHNKSQGVGLGLEDSNTNPYSAMEMCWVSLGQSNTLNLIYLTGCCENEVKEKKIM